MLLKQKQKLTFPNFRNLRCHSFLFPCFGHQNITKTWGLTKAMTTTVDNQTLMYRERVLISITLLFFFFYNDMERRRKSAVKETRYIFRR